MICSSCLVPSVAVTSACVSPRVNSAEPCVRGSTPRRTEIGRTVRVSRPSMRGSPLRIWLRTSLACMSNRSRRPRAHRLRLAGGRVGGQALPDLGLDLLELLRARLLAADLVGRLKAGAGERRQARLQGLVLGRGLPVPDRLARLAHQFVDRVDHHLHLFMAEHDRAEHHVLAQLVGFGLDHQHGALGAGDHQVQARGLERRGARVQHVLAVDVADARGADRAIETECRRSTARPRRRSSPGCPDRFRD
jgi:hypothetical protein